MRYEPGIVKAVAAVAAGTHSVTARSTSAKGRACPSDLELWMALHQTGRRTRLREPWNLCLKNKDLLNGESF